MEDLYQILGVKPDSTLAEIRRAYRNKVKTRFYLKAKIMKGE